MRGLPTGVQAAWALLLLGLHMRALIVISNCETMLGSSHIESQGVEYDRNEHEPRQRLRLLHDQFSSERDKYPHRLSSRKKLTLQDQNLYGGCSLFDEFARVVCTAECVPRKELYESWEVARYVHRNFSEYKRFVDMAAGHGLLSLMLLVMDVSRQSTALCVDTTMPESAVRLFQAFSNRWPDIATRHRYVTGSISEVKAANDSVLVSVHACGDLTDMVLELAASCGSPVAVLPCCHRGLLRQQQQQQQRQRQQQLPEKRGKGDRGEGRGRKKKQSTSSSSSKDDQVRNNPAASSSLPPPASPPSSGRLLLKDHSGFFRHYVGSSSRSQFVDRLGLERGTDAHRAKLLQDEGYEVSSETIPREITLKNYLIIGRPKGGGEEVVAAGSSLSSPRSRHYSSSLRELWPRPNLPKSPWARYKTSMT